VGSGTKGAMLLWYVATLTSFMMGTVTAYLFCEMGMATQKIVTYEWLSNKRVVGLSVYQPEPEISAIS